MKTIALTTLALALLATSPLAFAQAPATAVRTTTPKSLASAEAYQVPGRTEPFESTTVFTRATGLVRERNFDIGDFVKAGAVLAVIATPEIDRAVEAARASVDQAVVRAENARVLAERATTLLASRATSRDEADQRNATAAELAAAVRVARAELARLEEQQQFAIVRAPFDAVVAARNFDRGDRVRGDASTAEGWLYRLVRLDVLRFTIAATPDLALRLEPQQTATVRFNEFPDRAFTARVARSSQTFDPASGTMRLELALENKDRTIPAGLTGTASFELKPPPNVVLVPTNTLLTRNGENFVATVDAGKVQFVAVTARRNLGTTIEVTSERLTAATPIIINPNALLHPGDPVETKPQGS